MNRDLAFYQRKGADKLIFELWAWFLGKTQMDFWLKINDEQAWNYDCLKYILRMIQQELGKT